MGTLASHKDELTKRRQIDLLKTKYTSIRSKSREKVPLPNTKDLTAECAAGPESPRIIDGPKLLTGWTSQKSRGDDVETRIGSRHDPTKTKDLKLEL